MRSYNVLATIQLQAYGWPKGRGKMMQSKDTFTEVHVVAILPHGLEVWYYLFIHIQLIMGPLYILG